MIKPIIETNDIPVYKISEVPFAKDECVFINAGERVESIRAIRRNIYAASFSDIMNEI